VRWVCKCSAGAVAPLPKREWGRAGETRSFGLDDGECETCVQESGGYARMESLPKNMHWAGTWERVGGQGSGGSGKLFGSKTAAGAYMGRKSKQQQRGEKWRREQNDTQNTTLTPRHRDTYIAVCMTGEWGGGQRQRCLYERSNI